MEILTEKQKENLTWIMDFLKQCLEHSPNFTGSLEINFFNGGLANINKKQSFKKPERK